MAAASFQSMRNFWKEFSLPELQKSLDTTATELADRQDESDTSRRRLVELSKEFKKSTPEDVRKKVAPLLKSFQLEVDSLSKRSKASESAFLSIYKKLVDIPDPLPILEQAVVQQQKVSKLQDYEIENKQLRETLDEYNTEFAEVKNQEVTINRLKEKLKEFEEKIEDRVQVRVKEQEKQLQRTFTEKEKQLQETQVSVARKLGEAEHRVLTLQTALDSSQSELFDVRGRFDETEAARSSEVEILEGDVERTNQRALAAERQVEALREELMKAQHALQESNDLGRPNMDQAIDAISRSSLEHELAAKERQIAQLVSDVQHLQASVSRMKESKANEVGRLEEQLAAKTTALQQLETRLDAQKDYTEVKRELSVLKLIEFSNDSDEQDAEQDSAPKSLEMLLLDKNKRLQSENTSIKVENAEVNARYSEVQKQYGEAVNTILEQKELIVQLEADLLSVNALPSAFRGQGEGEAGPPSETELVASAVQSVSSSSPAEQPGDKSAADSLLPIVASQRERFKVRNAELEAQTRHQQQQISILQNEVDNLRSDNVKLYEKIKFLQSYPAKQASSSQGDEAAVSRYSSQYEQRLDPFSAFNQREKQQRYMGLNTHEKVILNMGRFILGNKVARTFAFFYTILVHLLIFLVLYKLAYTESCKRDIASECSKRFAEHMQQVHGGHT